MEKSWNDLPFEEVTASMRRKFIWGEKLMIAKMQFDAGCIVPWHSHENEQIFELVSGNCRVYLDNDNSNFNELTTGDFFVFAPNRPHKVEMVSDVESVDTFSPPRQDWIDKQDDYLRK